MDRSNHPTAPRLLLYTGTGGTIRVVCQPQIQKYEVYITTSGTVS